MEDVNSISHNVEKSIFGDTTNTIAYVNVAKFGNRNEIIKNMRPFAIPYNPNGYIKVACP